jgi:ABC-type nitrate/sulfonate/bicarbonate transport system permease component
VKITPSPTPPTPAQAFKADVKAATAKALGAKYKPTLAKAVAGFSASTAHGIAVELLLDLGGDKVRSSRRNAWPGLECHAT